MKVCKGIIYVVIVVTVCLIIASKQSTLQEEINLINQDIEEVETFSSLNREQLDLLKEKKLNLEERERELEELRKWLILPNKSGFQEAVMVAKTLGYGDSKDKCFTRYMQARMIGNYLVYISGNGVRKYKHSYLVKQMTSSNDDWWDKYLYNSVDGEEILTNEVVISPEALQPRQRLKNFLDTMGGVFIEK